MQQSWLDPSEQRELVELFLTHQLIEYSNARNFPLKSGGKTDVYMNLRDARSYPRALQAIARAYEDPLRRLQPHSFIEVPHAVSCFAGPLSIATGIPYVTIRDVPKAGRVSRDSMIGSAPYGSKVVIIDDVITDGTSKVEPYFQAKREGWRVSDLVVLVDRQQGWRENFADRGISLKVWSGMTLHDVRRLLITDFGVMQRCKPETEENNCIIVALDNMSREKALSIADRLRPTGSILKVNDLLFDQGIAALIPDLQVYGRVMADLKCHDIPNTVKSTCQRLAKTPPWAVTVHASGGSDMIRAAVNALHGTPTQVLAVTVPTSINEETSEEVYHRRPLEAVIDLAKIAVEADVHGFVCAPEEASALKSAYPEKLIVTPGIRSAGRSQDDQARISTPKEAKDLGADYLVMGRQIADSIDPAAEVSRILAEELGASA